MSDLVKILMADDDETFLNSTADLLRKNGYECGIAKSASQVIEMVRKDRYDLLIADIKMPGNPNLELVQELKKEYDYLPVILVTGYPSVQTAVKSIELPIVAYLVKPFDFEELLEHVGVGLQMSRTYRVILNTDDRLKVWRKELKEMTQMIKRADKGPQPVSVESFYVLAYQNIIDSLEDLKNLTHSIIGENDDEYACQLINFPRVDRLIDALRSTIEVLKTTKKSFKSDMLARLRNRLEMIVEQND